MKKAKIILTSLTVLAVLGGALAFKAQNFGTRNFYYPTEDGAACTIKAANMASSFDAASGATLEGHYTTVEGGDCIDRTLYPAS